VAPVCESRVEPATIESGCRLAHRVSVGCEQPFERVWVEHDIVVEPQQVVGARRHCSGEGEAHSQAPEQVTRAAVDLDVGIGRSHCLRGAVVARVVDQVDVDRDSRNGGGTETRQARQRVLPAVVAGEQGSDRRRLDRRERGGAGANR
jgi:hypothetical protein